MEPKESIASKVRAYIEEWERVNPAQKLPPNPLIAEVLGLESPQVGNFLGRERFEGRLAHPQVEETTARRRQIMQRIKNSQWPEAEVYCRLGMTGAEAHYSLLFERDIDEPANILTNLFIRRRREARKEWETGVWKEGDRRDLTDEEKAHIRKYYAGFHSAEEISSMSYLWVNSFRTVQVQNLPLPETRLEWWDILDAISSQTDQLVQGSEENISNTHIRNLPPDQFGPFKMFLADWMEEVDFHQIGSRRFRNPDYIAVMLYRQILALEQSGVDLTAALDRRKLQVPGASTPRGLFKKIGDIGYATEKVLAVEDDDSFGLSLDIQRSLGVSSMKYHEWLKFCTYYFLYLKFHPRMTATLVTDLNILESQIRQELGDQPQTARLMRNWRPVQKQLMDQVRPQLT